MMNGMPMVYDGSSKDQIDNALKTMRVQNQTFNMTNASTSSTCNAITSNASAISNNNNMSSATNTASNHKTIQPTSQFFFENHANKKDSLIDTNDEYFQV